MPPGPKIVAGAGGAGGSNSEPKEHKPHLQSGHKYGESAWSSGDEPAKEDTGPYDEADAPPMVDARLGTLSEAHKAFRAWRKLPVNWDEEFPELAGEGGVDQMELLHVDIGKLYRRFGDADVERRLFGYIPLMASSSFGQLGALNAESFCERVLSCAGMVLSEGNTLLGSEECEMLTILRMNRTFIEHIHTCASACD